MKYPAYLLIFFVLFPSLFFGQKIEDQIQIPNRVNSEEQQEKPYVILISVDGFRHDYFEKWNLKFLSKMRKKGVSAKAMIPSYPSTTFPNHYTIVTGLIPPHHGIIGNRMWNPKTGETYTLRDPVAVQNPDWYHGTPIWSLAEQQKMLSACFYWPGSEAKIAGYSPSYYYPYSETKGIQERVDNVVKWLELPEERRPHLITFYLPEVDQAAHKTGPNSLETEMALQYVDAAIKKLVEATEKTKLPLNFIFLSDHGMTSVDIEKPVYLPLVNKDSVHVLNGGIYTNIFVNEKAKINSFYKYYKDKSEGQYEVYLKKDVPNKYHFSDKEDRYNRLGDIVLMVDAPYYFSNKGGRPIPMGAHGYLAEYTPDMNTIFFAWGPQIKNSKIIESFQNIHVYPVLAELLGLDYDKDKIDGDDRLVKEVLKVDLF